VTGSTQFSWQQFFTSKDPLAKLSMSQMAYPYLQTAYLRYTEIFQIDESNEQQKLGALKQLMSRLVFLPEPFGFQEKLEISDPNSQNTKQILGSGQIQKIIVNNSEFKDFHLPKEGSHVWTIGLGLHNKSKQQETALKFINAQLTLENMENLVKKTQLATTFSRLDSKLEMYQQTKYLRSVPLSSLRQIVFDRHQVIWLEQTAKQLMSQPVETKR
jgi:hypothetical protein